MQKQAADKLNKKENLDKKALKNMSVTELRNEII